MTDMQIVQANKSVEAQYVEMMVPLYSYGCQRKINKALSKLRGIHSVKVEYELQKVTVWGICNKDIVLETIRKKRKEARFWDQKDVENQKDENDSETKIKKKEKEGKRFQWPAKFSYKLTRSFKKKMFPLMLYLN